ncbi:MAG: hypothetical protein ACOYN0_06325 [Phycisphaerales bacterium]
MSLDLSKFSPGQQVTCTVDKLPRTEDAEVTILRLMRRDLDNRRALRRAQTVRRQRMVVYNRGNRDWVSREKPAQVVQALPGNSWTMYFTQDTIGDLNSVAGYISVKSA